MPPFRKLSQLLKATAAAWMEDNAPRLGAALAFYSVLSIGPLLLIIIAIAGSVFGEDAARGQLLSQMRDMLGPQGAEAIRLILVNSRQPDANLWATLIGLATLLLSASGVFGELQSALNTIWKVPSLKVSGTTAFFKARFLSFSMVLGVGFLLLISLVLTSVLSGIEKYVAANLPIAAPLMMLVDFIATFGIVTLLFAMMFKVLPETTTAWRDIWVGAAITGILFNVGKFFIGLYLGHSAIGSTYGAAGSLAVLVIWIYYSAQILYFGAEFTKVYATMFGSQAQQGHVSNT